MRSLNSMRNIIVSMIMNIITILIGFVAQAVFVKTLGSEYLGINGLFSNILSMLGIIELGFGSAIIYHLYKPIAENDINKIKSLMKLYKIVYRIIAVVIFILGICLLPFLKLIVGEVNITESIYFLFILYLFDIIASYLLTYKRSILYADQKVYITNIVHIGYLFVMNISQIIVLYLTHNFILYLIIKIICRILENLIITLIVNKKYKYIKEKDVQPLDSEIKKDIIIKVKGLLFHKIGGFLVKGTDNIIISITPGLGIINVGYYSNYNLIIGAVTNLFVQAFSVLTSSVGNLLIEKDKEKSYSIFKSMLLFNSWIFAFASAAILCISQYFVEIWVGKEYLLSVGVLIVLVINFYVQGIRLTFNTFKEAAGIFHEDRYVPLLESAINLISSLILAYFYGLPGVFVGTIISSLVLYLYSYPKFVYKTIFNKSYLQYFKELLKYLVITFISVLITYFISKMIIFENIYINILVNVIICLVIPNLIYYLIFHKTIEFMYYRNLISNILTKFFNRKERIIS